MMYFPYKEVRKKQDELIKEIDFCIQNKKNLIVHAPTGLGKTAAVLGPGILFALNNEKPIFFLTSRHTQHIIVIETLRLIKEKYGIDLVCADIIGKKWMCPIPGTDKLGSGEFYDYCKSQRADDKCEFYVNTRKKSGRPTIKALNILDYLKKLGPCACEKITRICCDEKLCPYEISLLLAAEAQVIIADYYHIFHPTISKNFLQRAKKELANSIIVVDEGHNLPRRARDLLTSKLSNFILKRAINEAKKFKYNETKENLEMLRDVLLELAEDLNNKKEEKLISKNAFVEKVKLKKDYDELIAELEFIGDEVREKQKKSYIGSISHFLEAWLGQDDAFARILSKKEGYKEPYIVLSYRCLDPALLTKNVVNNAYSVILMSGTLTPTNMYHDLLGFQNVIEKEFDSPFPSINKLSLIIPETTTKFTKRDEEQYKKIADILSKITNAVPGNCAVFFPSYKLRDDIDRHFQYLCRKTTFYEVPNLSNNEKKELLEKFKSYKDNGAVLLGVASGSFSMSIDLPGDLLKAVVVVGLPLERPDLETKELIDYYDKKYGQGWNYGYVYPAIAKCLQGAGRCIRSETDKGIVVFLDERFAWSNYFKCFPKDLNIKVTRLYMEKIKEFFGR